MRLPPVIGLSIRSILSRRITALLTVVSIAVSVMLFAGVEKIREGAQTSFERTISGTDLIVGARSSPVNLLLYSVFHLGNATNNVTWETYDDIASRDEVAWTVPLSLGDSHRGYRVVGTTQAIFEHYRHGRDGTLTFERGRPFEDLFDAVLGADVAGDLGYAVGQDIVLAHGLGATSFAMHDDKPFRVSGILKRTGTPLDRSILVSLKGIEAIHVGWQGGGRTPLASAMTADRVRGMDLQPREITAFLVGLKSKIGVLKLQRDVNTFSAEPLSSVIPGVGLSQLWRSVGTAQQALSVVSLFVIGVGVVGILTSILTSLNERRREMSILRAVGARPVHIFALLVSEASLLALAGSLSGLAFLYAGLGVAAPILQSQFGIALAGVSPGLFDLWLVSGVTLATALLSGFPAWLAVRRSLADGLTVRL